MNSLRYEYQIKTNGGMYVGLFNFGRTYKPCKSAAWLRGIDLKTAKMIANSFNGTLKQREMSYCVISDFGEGWEVVCWCDGKKDAYDTRDSYNKNDKEHYYRVKIKWHETDVDLKKAA